MGGPSAPCQCTSQCSTDTQCGSGYLCVSYFWALPDAGPINACEKSCSSTDCGGEYTCDQAVVTTEGASAQACALGCMSGPDCVSGVCDSATGTCLHTDGGPIPDAGFFDGGLPNLIDHCSSCAAYDGGAVCNAGQQATALAALASSPITLPGQAAALNLLVDGGLTMADVEAVDCQGVNVFDLFGTCNLETMELGLFPDGGGAPPAVIEYNPCDGIVDYIGVGPGLYGGIYLGTLTAHSLDQTTTYRIAVDGTTEIAVTTAFPDAGGTTQNINLDWVNANAGQTTAVAPFDAIYRAAMATFAPTAAVEPSGTTCDTTGACVIGAFPSVGYAYFYVPALGWAMWAGPPLTVGSVSANAINRMDIYPPTP